MLGDSLELGLSLADSLTDGEREIEADSLTEGEREILGLSDGLIELLGEILADSDRETEADSLLLGDG